MKTKINFVDLSALHAEIEDEVRQGFDDIFSNTSFVLGEKVEAFEREFAEYCGTGSCVCVNSGTSALHLALLSCGVSEGDEVITVSNSFIATAEAVSYTGAVPVFTDIDPDTYTMDPAGIEAHITSKTKAIIPVHLFGQCADMDPILDIAARHGLKVIEDACQAHGAEYNGRKAGSMGDMGCFSFYPGKNLGAYGEGGAVVTDNSALKEKILEYRDHGSLKKYHHAVIGYNYRMDAFQGVVLSAKLKRIDTWNDRRIEIAEQYSEALNGTGGITVPLCHPKNRHVYHLYVIRTETRDALADGLKQKGIFTGIHYPIPIHLQEAYGYLGCGRGCLPITEQYAGQVLSLPMHPYLTQEHVIYITEVIEKH